MNRERRHSSLIVVIASCLEALKNCQLKEEETNDQNARSWSAIWRDRLGWISDNLLPSGSGIDNGSVIDVDASKTDRIVISFGFHHMDSNGYYAGWTDHTAVITPSLAFGYTLRITGRDRNDIKEYLSQTFDYVLSSPVLETYNTETEETTYKLLDDYALTECGSVFYPDNHVIQGACFYNYPQR